MPFALAAITFSLLTSAPAGEPAEVTVEFAAGYGGVSAPSPGGGSVTVEVTGLWALRPTIGLGVALAATDLLSREFVDCLTPCPSPDGLYALRGGPAVRLIPWPWLAGAFIQLSPQFELDLVHVPASQVLTTQQFVFHLELGADYAPVRHFSVGPRLWVLWGPDNFGLGIGLAIAVRSP